MQKALTEKQKRLFELFKVAIAREQEAQQLYADMALNCEDDQLRDVIETLRNSEQMHEEVLLERYKFIPLPGDIYFIDTLPVRVETLDVAAVLASVLVICVLATLYPARQAARLNPVEAIRHGE